MFNRLITVMSLIETFDERAVIISCLQCVCLMFRCSVDGCTATFTIKANAKRHERLHDKPSPYKVDEPDRSCWTRLFPLCNAMFVVQCRYPGCNESFTKHSRLQIHSMEHTNDSVKPYK